MVTQVSENGIVNNRARTLLGLTKVSLILLLVVIKAQYGIVYWLVNHGEVSLAKLLSDANVSSRPYPHWRALNTDSSELQETFLEALRIEPHSTSARRSLAHLALVTGNAKAAIEILAPLSIDQIRRNPMLYTQGIVAHSYTDDPNAVIQIYMPENKANSAFWLNDIVAFAHLQRATPEDLLLAYQLHPGDLYAAYHLWRKAVNEGDSGLASTYANSLAYFPLDAIHPKDDRLIDYVGKAIPGLLETGLWDRSKALIVVSFLVWQHYEGLGIEHLLEELSLRYPNEPEWVFDRAEVYHRRGDLDRAEKLYRHVITMDETLSQAYLRLGMITEERCRLQTWKKECLDLTVYWYKQYQNLVPDDLLNQKRLAEISNLSQQLQADTPQRTLDQGKHNEYLLDVHKEIEPNLVPNTALDSWKNGMPSAWVIQDLATGSPWNKGLCFVGSDGFAGVAGISVRLTCFWFQKQAGKEPGRYGLSPWYQDNENRHKIEMRLEPDHAYLIAVKYRTQYISDGSARITLSTLLDRQGMLAATSDAWRQYITVSRVVNTDRGLVRPLLTLWAPGSFWFDEVVVREVVDN